MFNILSQEDTRYSESVSLKSLNCGCAWAWACLKSDASETHWRMTGQVVENMRMWDVGCWPQNAMFGKNRLTLGSLSVSRSVLAHTFTFISLQNKVTPRAHVRRQRQPWWCCLSIFLFVELHIRIHMPLLRNIFWPTKDQGFTLVCFYFSIG